MVVHQKDLYPNAYDMWHDRTTAEDRLRAGETALSMGFTTGHICKFFWYGHLEEVVASYTPVQL